MKSFDQSSAACQAFTYKEGLLSPLAYDLRISVTSFIIELGENEHFLNARFDSDSLRVDCAMVDGIERPGALTAWEKEQIDRTIIRDVLHTDKYRDIVLTSSSVTKEDSAYFVKASLIMQGITREITFPVRAEEGRYVADVRLHLPDFDIKPFSALLGAIRIKPDILIRATIPRTPE